MKCICIDCEFNQPSGRTIEFAAICFDPKNGKVFDTFHSYVGPGEPINTEITALTGIDDEKVKCALGIIDAALQLSEWKKELQINAVGIVWGGGRGNDILHIYDEAKIENPFTSRVIDAKGVYQMLSNTQQADMRQKVGLKTALDNLGIGWDDKYGPPHRALADAFNTYRIYMFMSSCLSGGFNIIKSYRFYV